MFAVLMAEDIIGSRSLELLAESRRDEHETGPQEALSPWAKLENVVMFALGQIECF